MRKFTLGLVLLTLFLFSCQSGSKPEVNIIPQPQEIEIGNGSLALSGSLTINYRDDQSIKEIADYFTNLAKEQFDLNFVKSDDDFTANTLNIFYLGDKSMYGEEGYNMIINDKGIKVFAATDKGLFYGLQSLYQLMLTHKSENGIIVLTELEIKDDAMFKYRGMHLDVGRHMFPVEFIKKYIDLLALYKFNNFHWHLTEDQGWRIEIKKYPKLTEIGAFRKETLVGHGGKTPYEYDGKPYGGYYTQDEIREVVKYAAERKINVIPEIEMPGHSLAALASYPELACKPDNFEVAKRWGVFKDIYCTKEENFKFLEDVLTEVMDLFPSKYIHIGGDEAPKDRWKECDVCQANILREGLKDEHELQSYFIQRIERFLNDNGRQIIGWDEILEGGIAPNATIMSWRGTDGGIAAAKQSHFAIMTPGSHCYFDHYQADPENEPLAIGGYTTLEKVYSYNPIPDTLSRKESRYILGTQANVWTEYMETSKHVEYMVLPRMAALSEVCWTYPINKNWDSFKSRITEHFNIYQTLDYNYCDHPFEIETEEK
ncbi:MAG: beta-N-acetylglucosaminidase [Marinilabiliales bacterium]|nr:MAG: beta-N-acetylglucosaminidase [Marinilabiliales bacterium]